MAVGNQSYLDVPRIPLDQSLYVVWPGDGDECTCPLCDDHNCLLLDCECYNTTSFAPKLIYGATDNPQLYWSSVAYEKNNTSVYLFTEARVCGNTLSSFITKIFFTNYTKFLVRGKSIIIP